MEKYHQLLSKARALTYLRGEEAYDQAVDFITAAFRELEKTQVGSLNRIDRISRTEMLHYAKIILLDGAMNYNDVNVEKDTRELSVVEKDTTSNEWLDKRIMFATMYPFEDYFRTPPSHRSGKPYFSFDKKAGTLAVGVTRAMVAARQVRVKQRLPILLSDANLNSSDQKRFVLDASSIRIARDGVLTSKYLADGAFPMTEWQMPPSPRRRSANATKAEGAP